MLLPTMMGLLVAASMTSPVASQDRQTTIQHYTFLSHLSPLLEYTPEAPTDDSEQGWNVSLAQHSTNFSDSSVRWSGFATSFQILGNSSMVNAEFEAAGDDNPDDTTSYRALETSSIAYIRRSGFAEVTANVYNISVGTNTSTGSFIESDRAAILSPVPADRSAFDGSELPVAIHQSATGSDFFRDVENAWAVMEPPSNQSVGIQWQLADGELPTNGGEFPWNTTVLSTTEVGAPLRFTVPPYTSYLQWDGTVGPDQGRYEFRLIPTGDKEPQFRPISNNQTYTGERSVNAINEVKVIAWLDPRSTYDAEIVLLEEGKRTDLHGISFWRYTKM